MTMIGAKPRDVAKSLEEETGLTVMAALELMTLRPFRSMGSLDCSTATPQNRSTEELKEGNSNEQLCAELTW